MVASKPQRMRHGKLRSTSRRRTPRWTRCGNSLDSIVLPQLRPVRPFQLQEREEQEEEGQRTCLARSQLRTVSEREREREIYSFTRARLTPLCHTSIYLSDVSSRFVCGVPYATLCGGLCDVHCVQLRLISRSGCLRRRESGPSHRVREQRA
jgi:hypothetical protein